MRPLGIYLIGISMYILNMIHFLMILADFGVFSLMVTDGYTDVRTYRHMDGQTLRPPIEMRGASKKTKKKKTMKKQKQKKRVR